MKICELRLLDNFTVQSQFANDEIVNIRELSREPLVMYTVMMPPKKQSIGLLTMLQTPEGERLAVVHIRGNHNPETGRPESFAGCAQVTVHGGAHADEGLLTALGREVDEEFREMLREAGIDHLPERLSARSLATTSRLKLLTTGDNGHEQVRTLGYLIRDPIFLMTIQPLLKTGSLKLLREADLSRIRILDPKNARQQMNLSGEIAMFRDELEALRVAFRETFGV